MGRKAGSGRDRELGMDRPIQRRDFMNGAAAVAGSSLLAGLLPGVGYAAEGAAQDQPGYYPPKLTGLRGSHPGA